MPRKPKARDGLSAGERVKLYEAQQEAKRASVAENTDKSDTNTAEPEIAKPKTKKQLPKPQHAVVNVDLSVNVGEVKAMHGVLNGPFSYGSELSEIYKEISAPIIRLDGGDGACSLGDIFKWWGADPHDESSYTFSPADNVVASACATGAQIIFKLGFSKDIISRSNEGIPNVPTDTLVRICMKIVKRYRERGVGCFEISDICPSERRREVYSRLCEAIKLYDEDILVGASVSSELTGDDRELLKYCKKNHIPVDVLSVSSFGECVEDEADKIEKISAYLKNLGIDEVGIIAVISYAPLSSAGISEIPSLFSPLCSAESRKGFFDKRRQTEGAAYLGAMMLRLGEIDGVIGACAHDCRPYSSPWCPLTDAYGNKEKPFYVYREFSRLYRSRARSLCLCEQAPEMMRHPGIYATASTGKNEAFCFISSFDGCSVVDLRLDGIPDNFYSAEVYMLDGVKNMSLADTVPLSGMKKRLLLNVSQYGAILIRLY